MAGNLGHLSSRVKQRATQQIYANKATCPLQEKPLRLIINNYIRFPLSFYMTQQLARNIEGYFIIRKELLKCRSVIKSYVVSYSSCIIARVGLFFPKAHVFCVLNDAYMYKYVKI